MKCFYRSSWLLISVVAWAVMIRSGDVAAGVPSNADMKLTKVIDIATVEGKITALQDLSTKTFIVLFHDPKRFERASRIFLGTADQLFEQKIVGSGIDSSETWSTLLSAPRSRGRSPEFANLQFHDAKFKLWCSDADEIPALTPLSEVETQALLKKATFRTSGNVHRPVALARDEAGIYYYVDRLREEHGGQGYRVYVGKRGALKQMPLRDVAIDTAGMVFSTKKGELQLTIDTGQQSGAAWKSKGKARTLKVLDLFSESYLIHRELGVYSAFGAACDEQ